MQANGAFRTLACASALTVLVVESFNCGDIAFVAEGGSLTRDPDAARRFTIEFDDVSGTEIRNWSAGEVFLPAVRGSAWTYGSRFSPAT